MYIYILKKFPLIYLNINAINLIMLINLDNINLKYKNDITKPYDHQYLTYPNKEINFKLSKNFLSLYKVEKNNFLFKKKIKFGILNNFFDFLKFNDYFYKFFYSYSFNKKNFLILDNNYSNVYPIYKFIYGFYNISLYKSFFFIEPKYFILKNWSFFFFKFCKFNNISLLLISDYNYYINFIKNIIVSDLCLSAIVPYEYIDDYIDYPLYTFSYNTVVKIIYSSHILYIYSMAIHHRNLIQQYNYIKIFSKYINIF